MCPSRAGQRGDPLARGFPKTSQPFGFTANRATYIPREATERALAALLEWTGGPTPVAALAGPPGLGKSLLLHLFADRLEDEFHPVFLPYGAFTPEDLAVYALDRLGSPRTDDSVGVLKAYARHLKEEGHALLLLIDDAGAMPIATLSWLSDLARQSDGSLCCLFAVTDDANSGAVIAALGRDVATVRLASPMTPEETADYVEAQLAVARVPGAVRDLFDPVTVTRLHELSGGVPRRLHTAAQAVLRQLPETPPAAVVSRGAPQGELGAPLLGEQGSACDQPPESAVGAPIPSVASELQAEIERLRRGAAEERRARTGRPPFFRRSAAMLAAFGVAAAAGLVVALVWRPFAFPVAPGPAEPAAPGEAAATAEAGGAAAELPQAPPPPPPALAEPSSARAAPATAAVPAPAGAAAARERVPVNINASPWASIEVDGQALGETPLAGVDLPAGPHRFRARMPDGRVFERDVEIDAENRFVVFDEPSPTPPARP